MNMDLIEHERLILKNGKVDWISYLTNFEDNHTDNIIYYEHVSKGVYGDEDFCIGELIRQTDNWAKVAERIYNRYGCELDVDRKELVAKENYILVQTMLAIYAWIEFKGGD